MSSFWKIGPTVLAAAVGLALGPFDIALFGTPRAPAAKGEARLVFSHSPFGVAVTPDGHARYDVQMNIEGLPQPSSLGDYGAFVAWEATTDLSKWTKLGVVNNGSSTVRGATENKFLLVVTAERDSLVRVHEGPTILHGTSPSGWLQSFLTHPLFRGVPQ